MRRKGATSVPEPMMSSGCVCVTLTDVGSQFTDQKGATCHKKPPFTALGCLMSS